MNLPSADDTCRIAFAELRQFVERIEGLDDQKKEIADQRKGVMAEAKGRGYDTKIINQIVALRKRDSAEIANEAVVLEFYKEVLGL